MAFTDDDLKRLKKYIANIHGQVCLSGKEMNALLARLETAEKVNEAWEALAVERSHAVGSIEGQFDARQLVANRIEASRKAAGK